MEDFQTTNTQSTASGLTGLLLKVGVVSDKNKAQQVLVAIAVLFFLIAAIILWKGLVSDSGEERVLPPHVQESGGAE